MTHGERMTEMYAACIASMGDSLWDGSAAVIMIYPVVPDPQRYPNDQGRDLFVTHMEMGLAGAWMKRMIQTTFMHKLRGRARLAVHPGVRGSPDGDHRERPLLDEQQDRSSSSASSSST